MIPGLDRVKTEYDVWMDKIKKQKAKEKEKNDRKKALSSMNKDKKKSAEKAAERKQKVTSYFCARTSCIHPTALLMSVHFCIFGATCISAVVRVCK